MTQQLADFDARHVGGDGVELAADLDRRFGLQVNQVLMWRAAGEEDHDYGLVGVRPSGVRFGPQDFGQRHAAHGQAADFQEAAPRKAVAVFRPLAVNAEHSRIPRVAPRVET
jgi:hypothetical protein